MGEAQLRSRVEEVTCPSPGTLAKLSEIRDLYIPTKAPRASGLLSGDSTNFSSFCNVCVAWRILGLTCVADKLYPTSTLVNQNPRIRIYDWELLRFTADSTGKLTLKIFRVHCPVLSHPRICNLPACLLCLWLLGSPWHQSTPWKGRQSSIWKMSLDSSENTQLKS